MQHVVDTSSPIQESVVKAAHALENLGLYKGIDVETISRLLAIGRINSYSGGKDRQVLLSQGRFFAHSCQPNCIFVVEQGEDAAKGKAALKCSFRALRDISEGELLTTSYASDDMMATDRAQRQHYLLCNKGFSCACPICADNSGIEDPFERWPCPVCRPRDADGNVAQDALTGCCALRFAGRSPPWRSQCDKNFTDEEVRTPVGEALAMEVLKRSQVGAGNEEAAVRNAFLAQVIQCLGEDHWATQVLLRNGAYRAMAKAQALEPTTVRVSRCHDFLVSAGWPLGMMPMNSLYKAVIARARAEASARSTVPAAWPSLVAAAAFCAIVAEGPNSDNARKGVICVNLWGEPK